MPITSTHHDKEQPCPDLAPACAARRPGDRPAADPDHLGRVAGRLAHPDRARAGRAARRGPQHRPRGRPGAGAQRAAGHPAGLGDVRAGHQRAGRGDAPALRRTPSSRQIAELRSTLEASAAALAAARRTERDLELLDALLARREEAWDGGRRGGLRRGRRDLPPGGGGRLPQRGADRALRGPGRGAARRTCARTSARCSPPTATSSTTSSSTRSGPATRRPPRRRRRT